MNWRMLLRVMVFFIGSVICAQESSSIIDSVKEEKAEQVEENKPIDRIDIIGLQKVHKSNDISDDISSFSEDQIALQKKKEAIESLVIKASEFFDSEGFSLAGKAFRSDKKWREGGLDVFIFSEKGMCYVSGSESWAIWKNFFEKEDAFGESPIAKMLNVGEKGGWVTFMWNNQMKYSFVRVVPKYGQRYIIGAGFYPESADFVVEELVRSAATMMKNSGSSKVFTAISDPNGLFVRGDIYLYAYDFKGICMAHGANAALISQDVLDWQDSDGVYRNRNMIKLVREKGAGWMEYKDGSLLKRAYFLGVEDPKTNVPYIIGAGYYPSVDSDAVRVFVNKAIAHVKAVGKERAFADFSSRVKGFVDGPLNIFVYSPEGVMLADGSNPILIGQNLMKAKDSTGQYITKSIIDLALDQGSGWIGITNKKAYENLYVQHVEFPGGNFVIGCGYWPTSKKRSIESLVWRAEAYAKTHTIEETCDILTQIGSEFIRGDSFVSVITWDGITLASGLAKNDIWVSVLNDRDEKGRSIFDMAKNLANSAAGGGWLTVKFAKVEQQVYVRKVEKSVMEQKDASLNSQKTKKSKQKMKKAVEPKKDTMEYLFTCALYK